MPNSEVASYFPGYAIFLDGWGSPAVQVDAPNWGLRKYRVRSWTRSSGFHASKRKSRKGYNPNPLPVNPYTDLIIENSGDESVVQWKEAGCPGTFLLGSNMLIPIDSWVPDRYPDFKDSRFNDLSNKAIQKLPRAMNGSQFNLPIFLAEAKKTVGMVSSAAIDIASTLRTGKTNRQIHNLWLEYRYGWRLLLKDIYDALAALHDMRTQGIRQRVKVTATTTATPFYSNIEAYSSPIYNCRCKAVYDIKVKEQLGLTYTINYIDSGQVLTTLSALGITNPLTVALELTPYSFVFEWFIPVGAYLSTLDVYLGKSFSFGSVSKWFQSDIEYVPKSLVISELNRPTAYNVGGTQFGSTKHKVRAYNRSVLSTFPSQSLPSLDISINPQRMLDSIALLGQKAPALRRAWRNRDSYT